MELFYSSKPTMENHYFLKKVAQKHKEKYPTQLSMIIRFYFPKLEKDYRIFVTAYEKIAKSHMENINSETMYVPENIEDFAKEYQIFTNKLVEESKKLI
jgi:hypothetical protein